MWDVSNRRQTNILRCKNKPISERLQKNVYFVRGI